MFQQEWLLQWPDPPSLLCSFPSRPPYDRAKPSSVRVRVLRGIGLKNLDMLSKQDPYCVATLGEAKRTSGTVVNGGSDPEWLAEQGTLELPWDPAAADRHALMIELWDEDAVGEHDFIGNACLSIPAIAAEGEFRGQVQIYRRGTKARGKLELEVVCDNVPAEEPVGALVQATPAKIHRNHFAGVMHSLQEGDGYKEFKTYQVALQCIPETFGEAWNAGIDGIHPETFQDDIRARGIRTALATMHNTLYFDEVFGAPAGLRTSTHFCRTGAEFLELIRDGVRDGRRRVFTYSLTDEGLCFSETGAVLSKDNLSKHAIHANASMKVRYAGTFRICGRRCGKSVLVIDNDSGTYRPKGEHQSLLRELFQLNFAGLEVETLDVCQPQPEALKDLLGPMEIKGSENAVYAGTWAWRSE